MLVRTLRSIALLQCERQSCRPSRLGACPPCALFWCKVWLRAAADRSGLLAPGRPKSQRPPRGTCAVYSRALYGTGALMKIGRAPRTFQELIFALQHYWAERRLRAAAAVRHGGRRRHLPHRDLPARRSGPEPWSAAYVQPSRRPTDGRYGENPFRLQHYYQYQVVIKPSPLPILDLYLGSLRALGLDPLVHDVRFVEDNWESPTLGAWGLGWEVWLNGMEITQFTYFQQVGGLDCRPVTGEITYGLERLAMYLQGVESIYDIVWTDGPLGPRHLRRRVPPERGRAVRLQLRARRRRDAAAPLRRPRARCARACSRRSWRCRRTSRCSRPRTPSTCWTRGAPSR